MSFSFILVTRFRKIFTDTENAESAHYLFSLFYKTKKGKVLLILGVNQGIQIIGLLVYFFSQYEINERTEFLFCSVFFFLIDNL